MSGPADLDLTGRWSGIFNYPVAFPPVAFEAELHDRSGSIIGRIFEPDASLDGTGATLHSIVDGSRQGSAVSFSKMYEDAELMPEPVFYSGTIQPDGNEISGRWEIPGHWSGTFLMVRNPGAAEAAEEAAGEEAPVGGTKRRIRSPAPSGAAAARRSRPALPP